MMQKYLDRNNDSGVTGFQIGSNNIIVQFQGGVLYEYNHIRPGKLHVDRMKQLAIEGDGLNAYINKNVGSNFYKKS